MRANLVGVAAAILALAGQPALGQSMPDMGHAAGTSADAAFAKAMGDMMTAAHRERPTGDTDQDFVGMMLPHHQAAVDMAKTELQYGRDAELKALAQDIVTDQNREIATMRAWQAKHPK